MGSCVSVEQLLGSSRSTSVYEYVPSIACYKDQFSCLQLDEGSIAKLHKIFSNVDKDKSGCIDILELFMGLDIERNKFTKKVFSIFDTDGSGTIDFKEFVYSLWNYCTLAKSTLVLFAFDLYDKDDSGEIGASECVHLLHDVYGSKWNSNSMALSIQRDLEKYEDIDLSEFSAFTRTHAALLFPAFQMQEVFRRKILGVRFWERLSDKRLEISKGTYISVAEFMFLHLEKDVFADFIMQTHKINVHTFDPFSANSKDRLNPKVLKLLQDDSLRSLRHLKANKSDPASSGSSGAYSSDSNVTRGVSSSEQSEVMKKKKPTMKSVAVDLKFMAAVKVLAEGKDAFGAPSSSGAVDEAKAAGSSSSSRPVEGAAPARRTFDGTAGLAGARREKTPRRSFDGQLPDRAQGAGRRSREGTPAGSRRGSRDATPRGEAEDLAEPHAADRRGATLGRRVSISHK